MVTVGLKKEGIFFRFFYDMRRYYRYAMRLARASLRAEVANAYLNWLWWLIEPFSMMLIYGFIFGIVFQSKEEYFNAFLFIGLTIWRFFSRSVVDSSKIIRGNRAIISKVYHDQCFVYHSNNDGFILGNFLSECNLNALWSACKRFIIHC